MKPEFTPLSATRNGGSSLMRESVNSAMRRSASEPISASASAMTSAAMATGSAWKLPPESTSPCSAKTRGLSVTRIGLAHQDAGGEPRAWSRQAPMTWGWQRSE